MTDTRLLVKSFLGKDGKQKFAVDVGTPDGFRKRFFLNAWQLKACGFEVGKLYSIVECNLSAIDD